MANMLRQDYPEGNGRRVPRGFKRKLKLLRPKYFFSISFLYLPETGSDRYQSQ